MFSLLYNLSLSLFALLNLPKWLWQWKVLGKYRESLRARLGLVLPEFSPKEGQKVIWIHCISMGETRAIIPLFHKIRKAYPDAAVVISTTTETGSAEAKRSMSEAHAHFFLPLDFSWIIRRLVARIRPNILILCESDLWYHLLKTAKNSGAHIALVNGKVSERSCSRYQKVPFYARRLFSNIDILCLQSEQHRKRFLSIGLPNDKLIVTGNLKFDALIPSTSSLDLIALREKLSISESDRVLVIGSTHSPEEEWFLSALNPVWKKIPNLKVLLVPRHPERFQEVAHLFYERAIAFTRLSQPKRKNERLILIDTMGQLNLCYQIADVAIVGGSYTSRIGGHNIFEPVNCGVPVIFGPHTHNQEDLTELILTAKAGQMVGIQQLPDALIHILENPSEHARYVEACKRLTASVKGATDRTFELIFRKFGKVIEV